MINISTKDNHSAAKVAGEQTYALVSKVRKIILLYIQKQIER